MFESCLKKQNELKELFSRCPTVEARYEKIIELGRNAPPMDPKYKTHENIVKGCQSLTYLHSYLDGNGNVIFESSSDALISRGLSVLLIKVYSGETPETILKCTPTYLDEIGIPSSLTPNRANGLYNIHLRMKQDALKHILLLSKQKENSA